MYSFLKRFSITQQLLGATISWMALAFGIEIWIPIAVQAGPVIRQKTSEYQQYSSAEYMQEEKGITRRSA